MLPFRVFATLQLRSASSPPHLCALRALCVELPSFSDSHYNTSPKISAKSRQKNCLKINALRTLSFSVSRKFFACHSYENNRVYTNNSHSGTRYSAFATQSIALSLFRLNSTSLLRLSPTPYPPPFQILAHSFALFCTPQKRKSFLFKRLRTLCAKHPGGG